MTRNLLRAGALSCALLSTTAFCTQPALAQTAFQYRSLDANGVDLTRGDSVMSFTEATIGSGAAALTLDRVRGGMRGSSRFDLIALRRTVNADGSLDINIERGAIGERFTGTSGALTPRNADGATLTGGGDTYTHVASDGTVTVFGTPGELVEGGISSSFCSADQASETTCTLVPLSITSPDGRQVQLDYDLAAKRLTNDFPATYVYNYRLARVSNSFGYAITFSYESNEEGGIPPSSWYNRTGASLRNEALANPVVGSVAYEAVSGTSAVNVTDPAGRVWRVNGTTSSITNIRRPGGGSDHFSVATSGGQVTSVTNGGVTTHYARVVNGNIATTTITIPTANNPLNQKVVVESDLTIGRPTKVTDALNRTTIYQYDSNGRLKRVTAPEGNYVEYTYDARGNVTQTVQGGKNASVANIVTSASYDAICTNPVTCNRPNSVTDARMNVTEFTYDPVHGGVLTATAPAPTMGATRPQTRYAYTLLDGEYRLTGISACASGTAPNCVGTAAETRTEVGYDARGNVISVTQRDGTGTLSAVQTATYTVMGDVETIDGPLTGNGDTTRIRYNGAREVIGTIGPDPDPSPVAGQPSGPLKHRATRNIIDARGLVTRVDAGTVDGQSDDEWSEMAVHQSINTEYDDHARPVVQRLTSGGTTYSLSQASYDAVGRVSCTAQRMNLDEFAAAALPASACDPDTQGVFGPDRIARTVYDEIGRAKEVWSGVGVLGANLEGELEASAGYTANGQVETLTDGEGNRTTFVYDARDRLKQTFYPSPTTDGVSSTTDFEEYGYDPNGNVTSRRTRAGSVLPYSYDALNRLTHYDSPNQQISEYDRSYGYDNLGRLTSLSGHEYQLNFGYDALGRLVSESDAHGTRGSQYDAAGRRTRFTYPDGLFLDYTYLQTGELSSVRENGASWLLASFGHDQMGRRTSIGRPSGANTNYVYDNAGRLASLGHDFPDNSYDLTLSYTHNPAGQIVSRTSSNDVYSYGAVANGAASSTANGLNQVTNSGGTAVSHDGNGNVNAIGGEGYGYTAENMLAVGGGYYFQLDPLGRPRLIHKPDWSAARAVTYDGEKTILEHGAQGISRRYAHGAGTDEPLVEYIGPETSFRRWLYTDERGSVIARANEHGTIEAVNRYDEYGTPASTNTGTFQYTGQKWVPELGMYDYKARIYNPRLDGRFMQPDPIGYGDGVNLYGYVGGDPVNFRDPSGLRGESCDDPMTDPIEVCGKRLTKPKSAAPDFMPPGGGSSGVPGLEGLADALACAIGLDQANQSLEAVERAQEHAKIINRAAQRHGVYARILAAIGVRETGFQNVSERGHVEGRPKGIGVFQLTGRPGVTEAQAFDIEFSANYAANMLSDNFKQISSAFPHFNHHQMVQAALAAYNMGPSEISGNPETIDQGTPGNNYGESVINIASCFTRE